MLINNNRKESNDIIHLIDNYQDHNFNLRELFLKTCILLKQDIFSYFRQNYYTKIIKQVDLAAKKLNYNLNNWEWDKIICLHLRLGDVYFSSGGRGSNTKFEYNGKYSSDYFTNKINLDDINYDYEDNIKYLNEIIPEDEKKRHPNLENFDSQAPININLLRSIVQKIREKNPDYKVLVVACKEGNVEIEHDYLIRTNDPNYDLYCMIHSKILICSRSNFCLMAALFHKGDKIYIPLWGQISAMGFNSKYDKNNNLEYFY
tara:strand:+ start:1102 stop:1881 length:780 start_codon:yes stop_codon:yes gene_type:complete